MLLSQDKREIMSNITENPILIPFSDDNVKKGIPSNPNDLLSILLHKFIDKWTGWPETMNLSTGGIVDLSF